MTKAQARARLATCADAYSKASAFSRAMDAEVADAKKRQESAALKRTEAYREAEKAQFEADQFEPLALMVSYDRRGTSSSSKVVIESRTAGQITVRNIGHFHGGLIKFRRSKRNPEKWVEYPAPASSYSMRRELLEENGGPL